MTERSPISAKLLSLIVEYPGLETELTAHADAVDAAIASLDAKRILGCWARARRFATKLTGVGIMDDIP